MGHLNVRFWVAKSFEGLAGLAARLGMPRAFTAGTESTLVVREQHIRFLREARAGAGLIMTGGVVEIGETDARLLLVIRHLSGEPAASFQVVVSHVTSADLRPFPWPARIREAAQALLVEVPTFAAARGLDLSPVDAMASHAKALELNLTRIGLGVIAPAECDVFGRMRGEVFIGRVSDGVNRLFGETRPGPEPLPGAAPANIGGAVLEYRVLHLGWPRAGDSIELRSGFAAVEPRTRRVMHWMVDPVSGRPWCSAEAVVISFDLDARKVVDISAAAQEAYRAQLTPGLRL
nr:acyl-ACP thioesterase [Phenylobacterium glaciei]